MKCRAQLIVTWNIADFPQERLAPWNVEATSPDDFLLDQIDLDRDTVWAAVNDIAAGRGTVRQRRTMSWLRSNGTASTSLSRHSGPNLQLSLARRGISPGPCRLSGLSSEPTSVACLKWIYVWLW